MKTKTLSTKILETLGPGKTTLIITAISILTSVLVILILAATVGLSSTQSDLSSALFIAIFVPGVISPLMSWYFLKLLLRVQTLEKEVKELTSRDPLTGLLTRSEFFLQAQNYINHAVPGKYSFSVILADLDNFKNINEQYGRLAGDKVLTHLGQTVTALTRDSDITAHLREDELIFLLPHTNTTQALGFSNRLTTRLQETTLEADGNQISYTVSLGIASYPETGTPDLETLITLAAKALTQAKTQGRARAAVHTPEQTSEA